jgi:hypothetical protein
MAAGNQPIDSQLFTINRLRIFTQSIFWMSLIISGFSASGRCKASEAAGGVSSGEHFS